MESSIAYLQPFLDYLRYERQLSYYTYHFYKKDLVAFDKFIQTKYGISLANEGIESLTRPMMRAWVAQLTKQPASQRRKLAALRTYLKFYRKQESNNPEQKKFRNLLQGIRLEKKNKRLPQFLSPAKAESFFKQLPDADDFIGWRDRCLLALLYGCGLRRAELAQLSWGAIEDTNQRLRVLGKGNKIRLVPYTQAVQKDIQAYVKACEHHHIDYTQGTFLKTNTGKNMRPQYLYLIVRSYLISVPELSKKGPHIWRHTYATHLLNEGADISAIKDLLGHSSLNATQVYAHTALAQLKNIFLHAHPLAQPTQENFKSSNKKEEEE